MEVKTKEGGLRKMEKLKQGKMDRKAFWITFGLVCLIFVLMAVNLSVGDPLGDFGRGAVGILAFVIYMTACAMRLRDAGKSMAQLFILFFLPIYAVIIGCYESEDAHSIEEPAEADQF